MSRKREDQRIVLQLLVSLARETRCCTRDEAFCAGVTFQQFNILDAVACQGELHLTELHAILSVEKSTTTRLVQPLIRKGLLQRVKADHDSRAVKLVLTAEGIDTHRKVWSCLSGFLLRIMRQIPGERLDEVADAVRTFAEALRAASGKNACCN